MPNRKHFPVIGTIYGDYTVISKETIIKDNKVCLNVQCKCKKIEFKLAKDLKSGRCKSCKSCASKNTAKNYPPPIPEFKGIGDLGATYFNSLKDGAIKRNLEFTITIEYAWDILKSQNFRCNLSKIPINLTSRTFKSNPDYSNFNASLDRIDNDKGYIAGNIQWLHKDINKMKWKFNQHYFIELCKNIASNN